MSKHFSTLFLVTTACLIDVLNPLGAFDSTRLFSSRSELVTTNPLNKLGIIEKPTIYFPSAVASGIDKFNTSLSPDGSTIYYTATSQKLGITGIVYQHYKNDRYEAPEFVHFVSADIPVADVQISPDGNTMLFTTFKDYEGKKEGFHFDIWACDKVDGKWGDIYPFSPAINSSGNEFYPIMTNNKTVYFNTDKSGDSDIYYSRYLNGKYQEPVPLPSNINSPEKEADAFIAPDESYIIFVRVDAEDGFGNSDLYISFNLGNNTWTDPKNMGKKVNCNQIDGSPYVDPTGQYLFFTSGRIDPKIKKKAMQNYASFSSILSSYNNGSLNTHIMSFNPNDYR